MWYYLKRAFGALLCGVGLHDWQAFNESTDTLPGDMDPNRITDIHCDRCGEPHPVRWLLTESDGPKSYKFPRAVSERHALKYLRDHYAGASVDYIDREWHVIFYRVPKKLN